MIKIKLSKLLNKKDKEPKSEKDLIKVNVVSPGKMVISQEAFISIERKA